MIDCLLTQTLAFLAVFVYATHATQAIAFEWKPGFRLFTARFCVPVDGRSVGNATQDDYSNVTRAGFLCDVFLQLHRLQQSM